MFKKCLFIALCAAALFAAGCSNSDTPNYYLLEQVSKLTPAPTPTNVTVVKNINKKNYVTVSWQSQLSGSHYVYYNSSNDKSGAKYKFSGSGASLEMPLPSSGTWHFWIKKSGDGTHSDSAWSEPATIDFTYETLSAPTITSVTRPYNVDEVVVECDSVGAEYYWWYYSKANDSATATCESAYNKSTNRIISLPSKGTWYFWVKAADSSDADSKTSAFSEVKSYTLN